MEDTMLEEGLTQLNLDGVDKDRAAKLLHRYITEIELFNPAYGLVKVRDRKELIIKHILDSLAPYNQIKSILQQLPNPVNRIADAGSGAGLPGIPLAICIPETTFTLIERMGRRAGFLRNVQAALSLSNVEVQESDIDNPLLKGKFDSVVSRAFKPLSSDIYKQQVRLLTPGGIIAAYKGRRDSLDEEMANLLNTAGKAATPALASWQAIPVTVPFLPEERHLLVIRQ